MKLNHILVGIIACLGVLLLQGSAFSAGSEGSTFGDQVVFREWTQWQHKATGTIRNQIVAGTVNFGDEVILGGPGYWPTCRAELNSAYMLGICSDLVPSAEGHASVITLEGPRTSLTNWKAVPLIYGYEPGAIGAGGSLRIAVYYDRICFGPSNAGGLPNSLDACVQRTTETGVPDLKLTAGSRYVYLSELARLLGR